MAVDREAIRIALVERLSGVAGLKTVSTRMKTWDDVPATDQPALIVVMGNQTPKNKRGLPPVWELDVTLYIYCRNEDSKTTSPDTKMMELIKEIEECLDPRPGEEDQLVYDTENLYGTSLGGLVSHVWISGTIETDQGALGNQSVAIIPIEVLTI